MKSKIDWSKMKEPEVTGLLAAQPGWFVIDLVDELPGEPYREAWRIAIVGWRVMDNSWAEPLVADGLTNDRYYLLSPEGIVTEPNSASWPSVADFISHRNAARSEK